MYKLTTYYPDGVIKIITQEYKPSLNQMHKLVEGYIEGVPADFLTGQWFRTAHPDQIEGVWCDEEAYMKVDQVANNYFSDFVNGRILLGNILVVEKIGDQ